MKPVNPKEIETGDARKEDTIIDHVTTLYVLTVSTLGECSAIIKHAEMNAVLISDPRGEEIMKHAEVNTSLIVAPGGEDTMKPVKPKEKEIKTGDAVLAKRQDYRP